MAVIIGVFACVELYKALKTGGFHPSRLLLIIGMSLATLVVICGLIFKLKIENIMAIYLLVACMYCLSCGINLPLVRPNDQKAFLNGLFTGGMVFYISFPLFCLVSALLFVPNGWFYMIIGLFAPWGTDTFAYFTGVTLGKHKFVPHISPKKSWEGAIGGTCTALIVGVLFALLYPYISDAIGDKVKFFEGILEFSTAGNVVFIIILTLFLSVCSQVGDLVASKLKRAYGIKDYSNIFPGHGGILDRFDSALFASAIFLLLIIIAVTI